MKKKLLGAAILSSFVTSTISVPTFSLELEEIIVTAQKREQNSNDIAMAISAFDGDTLKELAILTTSDMASAIPGLTFSDSGQGTPVYTLRGVGFNESSLQATGTVSVYNDEIATPFPIMSRGPLLDVQRVEVLKGPQGTLYGRNTTGGAINYIANKPSDTLEAGVSASYGRFNTSDVDGYISGALSESVRARLAVKTIQSGDWQKSSTHGGTHGAQDKSAARFILETDINDSLTASLTASWWRDKSDNQIVQAVGINRQDPTNTLVNDLTAQHEKPAFDKDSRRADWSLDDDYQLNQENKAVSLRFDWDINEELSLTSLTSFSQYDEKDSEYSRDGLPGVPTGEVDAAGILYTAIMAPEQAASYNPENYMSGVRNISNAKIESWSQELRLSATYENYNWVAGINLSHDEVDSASEQVLELTSNTNNLFGNPGINFQSVNSETYQEGDNWAAFVHGEFDINDRTALTVGLRHSVDDKDFEGCTKDVYGDAAWLFTNIFGIPTEAGACATILSSGQSGLSKNSLSEQSTSGKIALDYQASDNTMIYASYSHGFKSGSFPTLPANLESQLAPVTQEKLIAYEVGFKSSLGDGSAQLNAAAFYYDYADKQLLSKKITGFGSLLALVNVPESTVQGVEFDLQWQPVDGLFLSLATTYLETEVNELTAFTQDSRTELDLSGSEFPMTPELEVQALVNYEWMMSDNIEAFVGVDLSYQSSFQTDYASKSAPLDPIYEIDSSQTWGARAGLRSTDEQWSLTLWGRNITDEFKASNTFKAADNIIRVSSMPATYGATLTYSWF